MLARGQAVSRIYRIAPKIQLVSSRTSLAVPIDTTVIKKASNAISIVPEWARTHEAKISPPSLSGRVVEDSRLVTAAVLPTALLSVSP